MAHTAPVGRLAELGADSFGVFRGRGAVDAGVNRKQLDALCVGGVVERVLPDTYRMTVVAPTSMQQLVAALLWAGGDAVAAGRSAGEVYGFEGVRSDPPEIVVLT